MDAFIENFHIDYKIIIAQLINFIIVLLVIRFLALKPIKKLMTERNANISQGLADAKTNKEILDNTKQEYEKIIAAARTEAHELFLQGKKEAEENKQILTEKTEKEIEKMLENSKKTIESEREKMMIEAKKEIVTLVVAATEKLLTSQADGNLSKKSIDSLKNI